MPSEKFSTEEFERVKKQIIIFNEIGKALTSSLDISSVLREIMDKVGELFQPDNWSLLLVDELRNELFFEIAVGKASKKIKDVRIKVGEGIAGWVAATGEPLFAPDAQKDQRFTPRVDRVSQFATKSILCVPLKIRNKVLGVIELINKKDINMLAPYDIDILSTVADYAAIALENARNYQRIQELTITDDVTGLHNSRQMHNIMSLEIERSKRYHHVFSVIFFDLDSFKKINDNYGHLVGSQLLAKVGSLVAANIRTVDFAARYGGDEFVVVLPQTPKKDALIVCKRLQKVLREEIFFREKNLCISITASFGIATFPEDGSTKDKLLQVVDKAMYQIKNSGKDNIGLA